MSTTESAVSRRDEAAYEEDLPELGAAAAGRGRAR